VAQRAPGLWSVICCLCLCGQEVNSLLKRTRSRIFLYLGLGVIGICVLGYLVHPAVLRSVGAYLVVEDVLESASAILVLNGRSPLRALEAARLYKDGWAPKVILSQSRRTEDFYAFESLGIDFVEQHEYDYAALLRGGVPDDAIIMIEEEIENTLSEFKAVLRILGSPRKPTLIIVTSNYPTRRTAEIWKYLADGQVKVVVRWTRSDTSFDTAAWWKNRNSIKYLVYEYIGLINYWWKFPLGLAFL